MFRETAVQLEKQGVERLEEGPHPDCSAPPPESLVRSPPALLAAEAVAVAVISVMALGYLFREVEHHELRVIFPANMQHGSIPLIGNRIGPTDG